MSALPLPDVFRYKDLHREIRRMIMLQVFQDAAASQGYPKDTPFSYETIDNDLTVQQHRERHDGESEELVLHKPAMYRECEVDGRNSWSNKILRIGNRDMVYDYLDAIGTSACLRMSNLTVLWDFAKVLKWADFHGPLLVRIEISAALYASYRQGPAMADFWGREDRGFNTGPHLAQHGAEEVFEDWIKALGGLPAKVKIMFDFFFVWMRYDALLDISRKARLGEHELLFRFLGDDSDYPDVPNRSFHEQRTMAAMQGIDVPARVRLPKNSAVVRKLLCLGCRGFN
ncbi:hypothetical protein C1H76_2173 [Elsinoe australis]|uniref:Uncharacterized protein n=1 Tax=Elsinoe australis TaxID=40998 RepID=A0A4U7B2Q8_9PEZI|nr:hypothetical protein C1H76_2173 [Elsinoe australis]